MRHMHSHSSSAASAPPIPARRPLSSLLTLTLLLLVLAMQSCGGRNKNTAYTPSMLDSPGGTRAFQASEDMEGSFALGNAKTIIILAGYGPISVLGRDTDKITYSGIKKVSAPGFMKGRDSAKTVELAKKNAKKGVDKTQFVATNQAGQLEIALKAPEEKDNVYGEVSHIYVAADFIVPQNCNVMVENNFGSVMIYNINGNVKVAQKGVEVRIRDVTGKVEVDSVNGPIVIGRVGGDADLKCHAGDIFTEDIAGNLTCRIDRGNLVHLSKTSPQKPALLQTRDGKIEAYLPIEANLILEASAARGEVRCTLPVSQSRGSSSSRLVAQLGSGGPKMVLRSTRGRIDIKSKGEFPELSKDALSQEEAEKEMKRLQEMKDDKSGRPLWQQEDPKRTIQILPPSK